MTQACGAVLPRQRNPGWECTGAGLIVVFTTIVSKVPVVLPARALDVIEPEEWWELPVTRFTGGDHLHLVVPRRPTTFRGSAVYISGDTAQSCTLFGSVTRGMNGESRVTI